MKIIDAHVAIIGSGTAGLSALREVEKAGVDWLLIESGSYGTMCARAGCMPSKLLIAASNISHTIDHSKDFGIQVENKILDAKAIFGRVRTERDKFVEHVVQNTQSRPSKNRIIGTAKFISPNKLQVDDHTLINTKTTIIATGSEPVIPAPFVPVNSEHLLLSKGLFELSKLPHSLAVVGSGMIGIELGQALQQLGVDVTIITQFAEIGTITDPLVMEIARESFIKSMNIHFNSTITFAESEKDGIRLSWSDSGQKHHNILFGKVLLATGRTPRIKNLNIEAAGVFPGDIKDLWNPQTAQVGDLPIFIAGDAADYRPLLHEASDEGRIAGQNAAQYPDVVSIKRRTPLNIAFTDPQIVQVGIPYADLQSGDVVVGEAGFEDQGRAKIMGKPCGMIRVYADARDQILIGAELFTPHAEHLGHLLAWVIQLRVPVKKILELPVYHPVLEEGLRSAIVDVAEKFDGAVNKFVN